MASVRRTREAGRFLEGLIAPRQYRGEGRYELGKRGMMVFQSMAFAFLLAQGEQPAGGGDANGGLGGIFNNPLLPLLVIGVMFYFLLILPERKKRKQLEEMLGNLKKNDPVVTSGGICGVVVNASPGSKYVTVRIDDSNNTRVRMLRSHITQIGSTDEAVEKDTQKKDNA